MGFGSVNGNSGIGGSSRPTLADEAHRPWRVGSASCAGRPREGCGRSPTAAGQSAGGRERVGPAQASADPLLETARPVMEAMVQEATGVKVLSLHHDISTVTGEEVVLFTLAEAPSFRDTKRR